MRDKDGVIVLGTPPDIHDHVAFFEKLLRGDRRGELLCFLARRITKNPALSHWYRVDKNIQGVMTVFCHICGAELSAGQKTFGIATQKLVPAHGKIHIEEALQGKYEANP